MISHEIYIKKNKIMSLIKLLNKMYFGKKIISIFIEKFKKIFLKLTVRSIEKIYLTWL